MEEKDIKILDNIFMPGFIKAKVLNKYGIVNILDNYDNYKDILNRYDKRGIMYLIIKYHPIMLYQYFKNYKADSDAKIDNISSLLNCFVLTKKNVMKLVPYQECKKILFKETFSFNSDAIYNAHKKEFDKDIDDSIKNNTFYSFINYVYSTELVKRVIIKLDTKVLVNELLTNTNSTFLVMSYNTRKSDIEKYILKEIKNDPDNINKYLQCIKDDDIYETIIKNIDIDNNFLEEVFANTKDKKCLKKLLELKQDDIYDFILNEIKNDNYLPFALSHLEEISLFTINNILPEQLFNVYQCNYYNYNVTRKILKYREKDLINYIVEQINNNEDYSSFVLRQFPYDLILKIVKRIKIDENNIYQIINHCDTKTYEYLYLNHKKNLLNSIQNMKNKANFFNLFFSETQNKNLVLDILDIIDKFDLKCIIGSKIISPDYKNLVFEMKKDEIINLFYNSPEYDQEMILNSCEGTNIRKFLVYENDINSVLSYFNILSDKEKDYIYYEKSKELHDYLYKEFKDSKVNFYNKYAYQEYEKIRELAMSFFTNDDIIDLLENYNNIKVDNQAFKNRIIDLISKNANNIIHGDFDTCVKLLKSLRGYLDDVFELFVNSIDVDDELLYKLFIERGLSDKQKDILYRKKEIEILNIVQRKLTNDPESKYELLQKGTPKCILKEVLKLISKEELYKLVNDSDFLRRKSIGEKFAKELCFLTYDNPNNKERVLNLLFDYKKNSLDFIRYFEILDNFLKYNGIDADMFYQYSLNSGYDFIYDVVDIYNNDKYIFREVYNYLEKNVFEKNNTFSFDNFLSTIKNFKRYKELCLEIITKDDLTEEEKNSIKITFNLNKTSEIKSFNDCKNIVSKIKDYLLIEYKNCRNIDEYKILYKKIFFLFSNNIYDIEKTLESFGNISTLKALKFYNAHNKEVVKKIEELETFTSNTEYILYCNNEELIKDYLLEKINDIENIINNDYTKYKELVR